MRRMSIMPKKKKFLKDIIKHPGALRETAKRMHLIKGEEKLSASDLERLEEKGGPTTARRARLARILKRLARLRHLRRLRRQAE